MDRKKLKQYKSLVKEAPKLRSDIDKLYERLDNVPTVSGKVTKSGDEFPYIEEHMSVQMAEPKEATEIKKQIRIKESRLESVEEQKTDIEMFIAAIQDSTDRQIFEMSFLDGKKQIEVAEEVGYTQGRVSQIIASYLKD